MSGTNASNWEERPDVEPFCHVGVLAVGPTAAGGWAGGYNPCRFKPKKEWDGHPVCTRHYNQMARRERVDMWGADKRCAFHPDRSPRVYPSGQQWCCPVRPRARPCRGRPTAPASHMPPETA